MNADVGDLVKIQQQTPGILAPITKVGSRLLEAEVIGKEQSSSFTRYTVRLPDGSTRQGNGHMIREIVSKANQIQLERANAR